MIPTDACLLRLYLSAADRWEGRPLYRAVVETARALHLAGASVFPAELGYGGRRRLHDAAREYDAGSEPLIVEVVDAPDRIAALLDALGPARGQLTATVEPVRVLRYRHHEDRP